MTADQGIWYLKRFTIIFHIVLGLLIVGLVSYSFLLDQPKRFIVPKSPIMLFAAVVGAYLIYRIIRDFRLKQIPSHKTADEKKQLLRQVFSEHGISKAFSSDEVKAREKGLDLEVFSCEGTWGTSRYYYVFYEPGSVSICGYGFRGFGYYLSLGILMELKKVVSDLEKRL